MNLYRKLFGLNLMKPIEDGGDAAIGGAADRGDNFDTGGAEDKATDTEVSDEEVKVATGEDDKTEEEEDQPRDEKGKFAKKERETTIPKARFDEQVRKERERAEAAERRLAEIEQQRQQVSRGADITKLEEDVRELRARERKALIKGDDKEAAELSEQADRLNRQIAIEQARDMSAAAKDQAREEIRWDMTLESIEKSCPALDETSEEFDQDLSDDVIDAMSGIMRRERLPRSQALIKAVEKVMERNKPVDEAPEGKGLRAAAKEEDRKEAAVKKNLEAANRQPASAKKVGADSDKHGQTGSIPNAEDMTFEEFNALPEATRAKMRGDFV